MSTAHRYALAHLSMIAVAPLRLVEVASGAGYEYTGFRLTPTASGIDHDVLGDAKKLANLRRAVDDAGIAVLDLEVLRMKEPDAFADPRPLLQAAQVLGARYVITTIEDSDPQRRVDSLARLAALAGEYGTGIAVEFMLFSSSPNLADCVDVVTASGADNAVVLADVLHLVRSGGSPADLASYPAHLFPYAQVCGASGAGAAPDAVTARTEAINARLMPDEGDLPVSEFIDVLGPEVVLSVECPLAGESDPADPLALAVAMLASARRAAGDIDT